MRLSTWKRVLKMLKKKTKIKYALRAGLVLHREYYGRLHILKVIDENGILKFKLNDLIFDSLTQAARHVCGDETRAISGPEFWRAPKV